MSITTIFCINLYLLSMCFQQVFSEEYYGDEEVDETKPTWDDDEDLGLEGEFIYTRQDLLFNTPDKNKGRLLTLVVPPCIMA